MISKCMALLLGVCTASLLLWSGLGCGLAEARLVSQSLGIEKVLASDLYAGAAGTSDERAGKHDPGGAGKSEGKSKLSIIIDDFGNGQKGTDEMLDLPIKITVAVMPFLPTSRSDAERAHQRGHDVIVHMPMEPKKGRASWLGPGAITSDLTDAEIRKRVEEAVDQVPYAIGINNHMGSKVTGDERVMSIVLEVCRERGLFFVDSKTNYHSIAGQVAAAKGLPDIGNDIFLDDIHKAEHITGQLHEAAKLAAKNRTCIAIGHVGTYGERTAAAIKASIPSLQQKVQFIGIGEMVMEKTGWSPVPPPIELKSVLP